jgi:hypothetical protein
MSTNGPSDQSAEQGNPTATANLEIQAEKVSLRATVTVPGPEAKGLLWLTRIAIFMLTGVAALGLAGWVAIKSSHPNSMGSLLVITTAAAIGGMGILGGVLLSRRLPRRRAKYYTVSAGRPTLHPAVLRIPGYPDDDNRPEPRGQGSIRDPKRASRARRNRGRRGRPRR